MNSGSFYKKSLLFFFLFLFLSSIYAVIAIYGDSQGNNDIHKQVVEAVIKHQPDITFHLGDLTERGKNQEEYDEFFYYSKPLTDLCPLYPVKGNHDSSAELFLKNFPFLSQTYYIVEHDSLLFIILDSTLDLMPHSEQFNWLIETFNSNPLKPKIILMHHPVFSSGYHNGNDDWALYLPALFSSNKVIAVFQVTTIIMSIYCGKTSTFLSQEVQEALFVLHFLNIHIVKSFAPPITISSLLGKAIH